MASAWLASTRAVFQEVPSVKHVKYQDLVEAKVYSLHALVSALKIRTKGGLHQPHLNRHLANGHLTLSSL